MGGQDQKFLFSTIYCAWTLKKVMGLKICVKINELFKL